MDDWTPAERAWFLEQTELLMQESKRLVNDINEVRRTRGGE